MTLVTFEYRLVTDNVAAQQRRVHQFDCRDADAADRLDSRARSRKLECGLGQNDASLGRRESGQQTKSQTNHRLQRIQNRPRPRRLA